jgi:membrane associated rhomboid family serine protease
VIGLIPVGDDNPTRGPAVITWLLIAVNVLVFLREPIADEIPLVGAPTTRAEACQDLAFFRRWAAIPRELVSNEPLEETAGRPVPGGCEAVRPTYDKVPALSVLYAMFLHGGWLHLLGNMLFLLVFGNNIEDRLGHVRFLLFYLLCGYLATYAFALANPSGTETLVGASGAIAGVLGAYLLLFPRARIVSLVPFLFFLPFQLPAWLVLGSWFLLQWMYATGATMTAGSSVAYLAHVAGFVAGLVLVLPFGGARRRQRPAPPTWPGPQRPPWY